MFKHILLFFWLMLLRLLSALEIILSLKSWWLTNDNWSPRRRFILLGPLHHSNIERNHICCITDDVQFFCIIYKHQKNVQRLHFNLDERIKDQMKLYESIANYIFLQNTVNVEKLKQGRFYVTSDPKSILFNNIIKKQ